MLVLPGGGKPKKKPATNPVAPVVDPTPPVTPPNVLPDIHFGGGNWNDLITGSAPWLAYTGNKQKGAATLAAQRKAALQTLLMQYGGTLPPGITDTYGDLSPEDIAAAKANPYSATALVEKQFQDSQFNDKRALAARGMLDSGDLIDAQNKEEFAHGQNTYNAAQLVQQQATQAINDYLNGINGLDAGDAGAWAAASEAVKNTGAEPAAGTTAHYDETVSKNYGQPLYRGPDNKLYKADGTPFTPVATGGNDDYDYMGHGGV